MKGLIVTIMVFLIGMAGLAAAEDPIEADLRILADQYTAASGYGDTQLFATNFRSYMIGSNRLDAAAEQQRKLYQFSFDTSIRKLETTSEDKNYVIANADYESKRNGQTLAKGKITATYSVRNDKLVLVMVKFADEVVKYKDVEKPANEKPRGKDTGPKFVPGPSPAPDFSGERQKEREI